MRTAWPAFQGRRGPALRRLAALPLIVLALAWLGGCASRSVEPAATTAVRENVVESALGEVGRPYRFGGEDPDGFDCSGLVQFSYAQAGLAVPRATSELRETGSRVKLDDALPGDLLFYRFEGKRSDLHVAIYLGDGRMVHAPASGKQVTVSRIDQAPWPERFIEARRLLR